MAVSNAEGTHPLILFFLGLILDSHVEVVQEEVALGEVPEAEAFSWFAPSAGLDSDSWEPETHEWPCFVADAEISEPSPGASDDLANSPDSSEMIHEEQWISLSP